MKHIFLFFLSMLMAGASWGKPSVIANTLSDAFGVTITFAAGDEEDTDLIPGGGICSITFIQSPATSDVIEVVQVPTAGTAASAGTAVVTFTETTTSATIVTPSQAGFKARATTGTAGGSILKIQCSNVQLSAVGDVAADEIWDAAGDLAVGSGADTAARLAKGSDGQVLKMVTGSVAWATDGGLADIVDDASQQISAGDLDMNSNDITGTGNINITGTGTFSGAVTGSSLVAAPSAAPSVAWTDSDTDEVDPSARINIQCTDVGVGTEDCDLDIQVMVAGSAKTIIGIDADGGITMITPTTTGDGALVVPANSISGAELVTSYEVADVDIPKLDVAETIAADWTATTPASNDDDTSLATTAFVTSSITAFTNKTYNTGATGNVLIRTVEIDLDADEWHAGSDAPATEGETPNAAGPFEMKTWDFADGADDYMGLRIQIPSSYDDSSDPTLLITWSSNTASALTACFCLETVTVPAGSVQDLAATDEDCVDELSTGTALQTVESLITITGTDFVAGQIQQIALHRDVATPWGTGCTADDLGVAAIFHSARLTYQVSE